MANKKNHKRAHEFTTDQQNEKSDIMKFEGVVEEALPATMFRVKTTTGQMVLVTLAGKLRMNHIRVLVGDFVALETSAYDCTRGRITWRK